MLKAAREYGDWLADQELVRRRQEWISAYREWKRVAPPSSHVVLTQDQRVRLATYRDAETAYFARWRALTERS
jgi:hypothetical protein